MTPKQRQLEAEATNVLSRANAFVVPVPLDHVAAFLGVQLHQEVLEDEVSGMLVCKGDESHIVVNSSHHPNRQRFTVAHECGHLVLHHHRASNRLFVDRQIRVYNRVGTAHSGAYDDQGSTTSPQEETEANQFASALLMPRTLIEGHIRDCEIDLTDEVGVARMALAFGVSEQAMSIRLQQLNLLSVV
jgi:Zn-dependent peptidase ImmA (M78 family)